MNRRIHRALEALVALGLSTVIGGALAASDPPAAAPAIDCPQLYKDTAAEMMKLSYWDFDQTEKGWRQLGQCLDEQALILKRYTRRQAQESRNVHWHLAQVLALQGDREGAAKEALLSIEPDDQRAGLGFDWNSYALATVAYLRQDRAAFDEQIEAHRRSTTAAASNATNHRVLQGLAICFDKPYREAYSASCRPKD